MEEVILVDKSNRKIGTGEKLKVHKEAKLHRAVSVLVFNSKGELLIQKRSIKKYHSGGLWSNSACSHPAPGETSLQCAHRSLKKELGFDTKLKKLFCFKYKKKFENGLTENEFDCVYFGIYNGKIKPNKNEVDDWTYKNFNEVKEDVNKNPDKYTFWFSLILKHLLKKYDLFFYENKFKIFDKSTLDKYHFLMNEYSKKVTPIVTKNILELSKGRSKRSKELLMAIHKKRDTHPRLREFILIQSYIASTNKKLPDDIYKIAAAIEIYNLSTYLINWFLDKKGEIKDLADERRAVIEGIRLYDKSKEMIRETSFKESIKNKIIRELEEVNNEIYLGQGDDIDTLNIRENVQNYSYEEYLSKYILSCKRKCGYFISFVARCGAYLAEAGKKETNALSIFGLGLGTGIQIVNDVADNIPKELGSTVERPYQDQFSDIENGLITASIYDLLKKDRTFLKKIKTKLNEKDKEDIYNKLIKNKCFDLPMAITRKIGQNICKESLKIFDKDKRKYLSESIAILDNSKIYNLLKKNGYKRSVINIDLNKIFWHTA